jgi:hypothetical protein
MIEFVSFTLFIVVFFMLIFKNVQLKRKLSATTLELITAHMDKTITANKLSEINNKTDMDKSSEDFLNFISESRDWAFQYIENVQEKVNKFISDVEPEIAYFDEYGVAISTYPHYHSMKKISGAYKELKTILPDDYGKIE